MHCRASACIRYFKLKRQNFSAGSCSCPICRQGRAFARQADRRVHRLCIQLNMEQRLIVRALMKMFSPAADCQTCRNHARQYPFGDRSPLGCGCAFCSKLRQTRTKRRPAVRLKCLSRACKLAQAVGLQPFCKRRSIYRYDSKCSTRTHEIMRTQEA